MGTRGRGVEGSRGEGVLESVDVDRPAGNKQPQNRKEGKEKDVGDPECRGPTRARFCAYVWYLHVLCNGLQCVGVTSSIRGS